jgi:hypothetical protein
VKRWVQESIITSAVIAPFALILIWGLANEAFNKPACVKAYGGTGIDVSITMNPFALQCIISSTPVLKPFPQEQQTDLRRAAALAGSGEK